MVLIADNLRKEYAGRIVLSGVSMRVRRGRIMGLLGPSGSGKSTMFKILAGIVKPEWGNVFLGNRDITEIGIDARSRCGLGYVPQSSELFSGLTTEDNLRMVLEAKRGSSRADVDDAIGRICRSFMLQDFRKSPVSVLSGGQRKLVEIAFAMSTFPQFLLLDEPFAKLDPIVVERISLLIRSLARAGVGMVLSDHNAHVALRLVDEATVIHDGSIVAVGDPAKVAKDKIVREVFLGERYTV